MRPMMALFSYRFLRTALFLVVAGVAAASGQHFQTIHTFTGKPDGLGAWAKPVADADGNLYGTATAGGASNEGCIYKVSPPAGGGGSWTETIIYSFKGGTTDGVAPAGVLIFDKAGNLYGTTATGGADSLGIVFELSPSTGGDWTESVLYNFISNKTKTSGSDASSLVFRNSELYGSSTWGGEGEGNVFALKQNDEGTWGLESLYSFSGPDGEEPNYEGGPLVFDVKGNLYGSSDFGGQYGAGEVFEVSPPAAPGGAWTETTLYSFGAYPTDGQSPTGGVVLDSAGNLYGTTVVGGNSPGFDGTAFELSPPGVAGQPWTETIIHSFTGGATDGSAPYAGVAFDKAGNLYGTTYTGGPGNCNFNFPGCGTVYELSPGPDGTWTERLLHTFSGSTDGEFPYAGLFVEPSGRAYGVTSKGGTEDFGTIFGVSP
jgi:uncharacterized repeat protein (TIGR03803 family)